MNRKRRGLLLGRTLSGKMIWHRDYCHVAIFGPSASGKSTSYAIPWLLTYDRGSVAAFDPKGELFQKTSAAQAKLGRRSIRIDPFGVCGPGSQTLNPLDLIGSGSECIDDCRSAADATVVRNANDPQPHWNDRSANVLTGALAYICANFSGSERSFASLREILCTPGMLEGCAKDLQKMGGVFAWLGGAMLPLEDKEKAGVLSTAHRHLQFLDSPAILPATASGWDAREFLTGKVAVYVILPPHQIEAQSRWLRLVIGTLLRLIGREQMARGQEALFLCDEAAALGPMEPVQQGLVLLRAAGVRLVLMYQSLGQLKDCWGEGKQSVLLDNTDHLFISPRDETAKQISERLGNYTETAASFSENSGSSYTAGAIDCHGQGTNYSHSTNVSVSVHARALLSRDEVERLPGNVFIAFVKGVPPIIGRRVLYYSDPSFNPKRFARLRRILKRLMVSLLVGVLFSTLFNIRAIQRGEFPWSPVKPEPVQPKASPTWPQKQSPELRKW
jgi:type IV secretion system protein VirD4